MKLPVLVLAVERDARRARIQNYRHTKQPGWPKGRRERFGPKRWVAWRDIAVFLYNGAGGAECGSEDDSDEEE